MFLDKWDVSLELCARWAGEEFVTERWPAAGRVFIIISLNKAVGDNWVLVDRIAWRVGSCIWTLEIGFGFFNFNFRQHYRKYLFSFVYSLCQHNWNTILFINSTILIVMIVEPNLFLKSKKYIALFRSTLNFSIKKVSLDITHRLEFHKLRSRLN